MTGSAARGGAAHPSVGPHVVVVGLMGAGKTTVGERLAGRLGVPFVDNDRALRDDVGTTAAEYQQRHGRARLHRAELRALRRALFAQRPSVIAAAASVADTEPGRALLADANVAWLDVSAQMRAARRGGDEDGHRPPDPGPEDDERRRRLAAVADVVADGQSAPDDIAASLCPWASQLLRG